MFTSRTREANIPRERSVNRSSSRCSCPKPFTTRTPVTSVMEPEDTEVDCPLAAKGAAARIAASGTCLRK